MIVIVVLLMFCCVATGNTIGGNLDNKFNCIQSALPSMKERYQQLEKELQELKTLLHQSCYQCVPNKSLKSNTEYDCTNVEPRKDCLEHLQNGYKKNGLYKLSFGNIKTMTVFCDQTTDGGGWTVFQRRMDGSVRFDRTWVEYREGFGELDKEHWLGNDNIHELTKSSRNGNKVTILINMKFKGQSTPEYAKYDSFRISDESAKYQLSVSGFSGNVTGGNLLIYDNNMKFTTKDQDNDQWAGGNCAVDTADNVGDRGPWWPNAGCGFGTLNGVYGKAKWDFRAKIMTFSEMKVRRN